jgi:hypothetical protein
MPVLDANDERHSGTSARVIQRLHGAVYRQEEAGLKQMSGSYLGNEFPQQFLAQYLETSHNPFLFNPNQFELLPMFVAGILLRTGRAEHTWSATFDQKLGSEFLLCLKLQMDLMLPSIYTNFTLNLKVNDTCS